MSWDFNSLKIIIIVDGWTQDLFHQCLSDSLLPEIQNELIEKGTLFTKVVSNFPSVSLSSHVTLLTGLNQNDHGVPGHRWMMNGAKKVRNYIGPSVKILNRDIYNNARTVFEMYENIHSISIQCFVYRGAKKVIKFFIADSEKILSRVADLACIHPNSLIVLWLPKGDGISHLYGPRSKKMVQEMISTSKGIGILAKKLRNARLLERTKIMFTSDHGHKAVKYNFNLALPFRKMGYTTTVNPKKFPHNNVNIFTNGDAAAFIYFKDGILSKNQKYEILCDLAKLDSIGLIFFHYNDQNHFVFSKDGISCIKVVDSETMKYELIQGSDPLKIIESDGKKILTISNLQIKPLDGYYPDIIHQYLTSIVPNRSSDILITASTDYHFGKAPRIGWRCGYHRGSHGGPSYEEMIFSAIISRNNGRSIHDDLIRSKDLIRKFL